MCVKGCITKAEDMDNAEILFLCPNLDYTNPWEFTFRDHLGASYIRAYLEEKGIRATQFIYQSPINLNSLSYEILKYKSDIIGFTCYDTTYPMVKVISERLKELRPGLIILAGGISATFSDELILRDSTAIDICVRREGEYTVYELIKQLRKAGDLSGIEGISYRSNGGIVRNPERPLIEGGKKDSALDILPSPFLNDIVFLEDNFGVVTSRGCVYRCTYCNFSSMVNWSIRYHSVERVIAELKKVSKTIQHTPIYDDSFTLNVPRAKEICRRIIEEAIDLTFWCQTRADRIDRELLELMYQAKFKKVTFGLESAVPRILRNVQKVRINSAESESDLIPEKEFINKVRENVGLAQEIGLDPEINIIMGLPGATLEDDKETLAFVKGLNVNSYVHHSLNIYPGTELFETHAQYGIGLKKSGTGLPYKTYPAYDLSVIAQMDNSQMLFFKEKQIDLILRILTGGYKDAVNSGYPDILFKYSLSMDSESIDWLGNFININSRVGFLCSSVNDETIRMNLKKIVESNIPLFHCYSLVAGSERRIRDEHFQQYKVVFNSPDNSQEMGSFLLMPFSDYLCQGLNPRRVEHDKGRRAIFALNNTGEIGGFLNLSEPKPSILDSCRWLASDCPAATFSRAFIEQNGSISPCFHGGCVGGLGDTRKAVGQKLNDLWEATKLERGCDNCIAKDGCSKCMFPYPLNEKEFCIMKKREKGFKNGRRS